MAQPEATGQAPGIVNLLRALAVVVLVVGVVLGVVAARDTGEGVAAAVGILQGLLGFAVLSALAFMCDMLDQIRGHTAPRA